MKSVAIYGFSETNRDLIHQSQADEIWSVNMVWRYDCPRVDRLFEMHQLWSLTAPGDLMEAHWQWLQQEHDFPIYMLEALDNVPSAITYPLDAVVADVFGGLQPYMTSTVSYMLALAIHEGFERIEIYGLDMKNGTEYAYQKAGAEFMLGVAHGRGIEIALPPKSALLSAALYGYDGGFQVISRQSMEKIRNDYTLQFDERNAVFQQAKGKYDLLKTQAEQEKNPKRKAAKLKAVRGAYNQLLAAKDHMLACDVAVQVANHMIEVIDIKVPDLEIKNNVAMKVSDG